LWIEPYRDVDFLYQMAFLALPGLVRESPFVALEMLMHSGKHFVTVLTGEFVSQFPEREVDDVIVVDFLWGEISA